MKKNLSWEDYRNLSDKQRKRWWDALSRDPECTLRRQWLAEHAGRKSAEFTRLYSLGARKCAAVLIIFVEVFGQPYGDLHAAFCQFNVFVDLVQPLKSFTREFLAAHDRPPLKRRQAAPGLSFWAVPPCIKSAVEFETFIRASLKRRPNQENLQTKPKYAIYGRRSC